MYEKSILKNLLTKIHKPKIFCFYKNSSCKITIRQIYSNTLLYQSETSYVLKKK